MTKSHVRRSIFFSTVLGILIGCFVGGLLGFFGYESQIESEQDQALSEYLLGVPWLIDRGFRLVRTAIGSALGATVGLVVGILLARRRRQGIDSDAKIQFETHFPFS
jgi:hypothetical protein